MAATGTPTPNIGLRIPQGTDPASVDDINYNSNLIDTKLGAVGNDSVQEQINSLSDNLAVIGDRVDGTNNSSTVSIPNDTSTVCSEIVLPAGKWLIIACADWQANGTGYRQLAIGSNVKNPGRNITNTTVGIPDKEAYLQQIYFIYTNGTTLSVYARQNSGSALNVYPYVYAIRIK